MRKKNKNKIFIISAVIMIATTAFSETKMPNKINDTFSDKVQMIKLNDEGIKLHFKTHAAVYKINKKNPKFEEYRSMLEISKNENKVVKIVVEIPSMEITSVNN